VRFFWVVLIGASAASVSGNAVHAILHATAAPLAVAAVVATAPPLVLLASTEGVSLLLRTRQRGSAPHWCALAMTVLLAACAFVLSFDALRDLAVRSGIGPPLAWLWPIAVDVSIAQATVALLSLSRTPYADTAKNADDIDQLVEISSAAAPADSAHTGAAVALIEKKVTKKSPELVEAVLQRYAAGEKVGTIAAALGVHHSTVRRLLAAHRQRTLGMSPSPALR
jgi:DNA-directed RNA polymerase specialized sigma24 family protein